MASGALPCPIGRLTIPGGRGGAGEMEAISASLGPFPPFSLSTLPHQIVSSMRSKTTSIVKLPSLAHGRQPARLLKGCSKFQASPKTVLELRNLQLKYLNTPVLPPPRAGRGATVQTGKLRPREVLPKVPWG